MATLYVIVLLVALLLIGWMRQFWVLRQMGERMELANEFLGRFVSWFNGGAENHALYDWILKKSHTVQMMLGRGGLMDLRQPNEKVFHHNVPVIINAIPLVLKHRDNEQSTQTLAGYVDIALRHFIGSQEDKMRQEQKRLHNPLSWFFGGVSFILELPLIVLSESKLITPAQRKHFAEGHVFSLLSSIASLAAFAATVMSLVTGWGPFRSILRGWIKQ